MEHTDIDSKKMKEMIVRFESFLHRLKIILEKKSPKRLKVWLDNSEVCIILDISKKTLQYYRETGIIPFTKVKNKFYYKPDDITEALEYFKNK